MQAAHERYDVIVIGQGYAGLTAARIASERGLKTANIEAGCMGGLIVSINELDPSPDSATVSGSDLASNLFISNMDKGVVTVYGAVTGIERGEDHLWLVKTDAEALLAPRVVLASGARRRKLGVPGEAEFFGSGVSECADCDGPLYRGKAAVIVGGGDSAFQEALALAHYASKVTIILRGNTPRARAALVERVAAHPHIEILPNTEVLAIEGAPGQGVESVRLVTKGEAERTLPTAGVFVLVGLQPNTDFLPAILDRDEAAALITSPQCATNLPGVWAIGAVRSGYGGLLTNAAEDAECALTALAAGQSPAVRDTVILGSGCAGLTAAIYAARANLKPLVLEGHEPGGQLSITTLVENFPGWPHGVQGPELIENMKEQATRFGAELRMAHLTSADLTKQPIELTLGNEIVLTRSLIIASGASARWLGLPSEKALVGFGVSSCATCDGFFASGKEIAVIGGGDSAMEEAIFLTRFATKVTIINRSENFRASRIMLERAIVHPQIEFLHNTVVEEVLGVEEKDIKGLKLLNKKTGERSTLPISFMFLGIGHEPNASMFKGQLDLDADGYIKTEHNVFCTFHGVQLHGVYACGDVQDRRYRQAITAAGSGCMAALEVEKFLEEIGR